jgi:nitrate reductase (NAD(P)H)
MNLWLSVSQAVCLMESSTDLFADSETAKVMMPTYHIGSLNDAAKKALTDSGATATADGTAEPRETFLQTKFWNKAILHGKRIVSWDTRIFTYQLDHSEQRLGLPVGQHLMVRLKDPKTNEAIIRSYTPISEINDKGFMDMLVKVYFDKDGVKGGKMSQAMDALSIGQYIEMKGPIGKFEYLGHGRCTVQNKERSVKSFIMICGGSGITPIYQVFRAIMQNPADNTKCVVLNGNRQFEDILCKPELDALAKDNDRRCELIYTLTKAPDDWCGLRGRIDAHLVDKHCSQSEDTLVLICGPEALERTMHKVFTEKGWSEDQLLFF